MKKWIVSQFKHRCRQIGCINQIRNSFC